MNNKPAKSRNPKGRGKGNLNKLTKEQKKELFETVLPEIKQLNKHFSIVSPETRIRSLERLAGHLLTGNDKIADEIREVIYQQLSAHYSKFGIYFSHIPKAKQAEFLIRILKLISPANRKASVSIISRAMKVRFNRSSTS